MAKNVLIEASAGTGKTQALAQRLIDLLAEGVKAREIVALTFSCAAAGEIFERFLFLLSEKAKSDDKMLKALRETISQQHLCSVATLDSFLMRIVRSFPLELGLSHSLELMDDYAANVARCRVSFGLLRRTDPMFAKAFIEAFSNAMQNADAKSFASQYHTFIQKWHEYYLSLPKKSAWGEADSICPTAKTFLSVKDVDFAELADRMANFSSEKIWVDFVEWVRNFHGSFTGLKGLANKIFSNRNFFEGLGVNVLYNKKPFILTGESAKFLRDVVRLMLGYVLSLRLNQMQGLHGILESFEHSYDLAVRRKGRLVFSDIPRLITSLSESSRLALEYRLDLRVRGWALDEFQDTSREQWRALSGLIDAAKQSDGEKSVFIVGDSKQAIYGWRNGDQRIFHSERESGTYELKELKKSYRSGSAIMSVVNSIFCNTRICERVPSWSSPIHETALTDMEGFVQLAEAKSGRKDGFVEPIYNALKAINPISRGITTAILVRSNELGELLARELTRMGIEGVVWEGQSAILDTPVLLAFLDLVTLSDHPGNDRAYRHFEATPLASVMYPNGLPTAAILSAKFAREFAMKGLVRTFQELRSLLPENPCVAWSLACEDRFTDMLRAAGEFEATLKPGVRLSDFTTFLAARFKRNLAEAHKIKIMTIHRSKGLGFDYVILPLYEPKGLFCESKSPIVTEDYILPGMLPKPLDLIPFIAEAKEMKHDMTDYEEICDYYVALTRARRAMTIILHPEAKSNTNTLRFSNYVRDALETQIGDEKWYEKKIVKKSEDVSYEEKRIIPKRKKRINIARRLPSLSFHTGMSASDLFVTQNERTNAIQRGIIEHSSFEKIEWIEKGNAKTNIDLALVKPSNVVELWREKSYELMINGAWESGCIDRVVFTREGDRVCALISDFKTNRTAKGETKKEFEDRMRNTYFGQMKSYRDAINALTGIPLERISTQLLLIDTDSCIAIEF